MTQPTVDDLALKELRAIMGEDFQLLVDTFVQDSQVRIESIRQAIEELDAEALRVAAHSFKGSALNLSAGKLTELCRQLEQKGRDGTLDGTAQILMDIQTEYDAVRAHLRVE
ncbi:Uncharacterised protein [BD1-7 clade bacterium]|uniref:HPt domain-containing protein n=1 Tax=BD1-7 clade bacterium TaxID=2029982 RepID=A0A5S9PY48_9GAMM|nr:Uncharacterised protein [BD1-7 clade bacterium]CAA0109608.1 Uncharacterised protein [BD1-7 clade bacterium]